MIKVRIMGQNSPPWKKSPGLCAGSPKANWDGTHPLLKDFVVPEWGELQDHPRVQVHLDSFGEWRDNLFPNRSVLRCILQRRSSVSIMERFLHTFGTGEGQAVEVRGTRSPRAREGLIWWRFALRRRVLNERRLLSWEGYSSSYRIVFTRCESH